MWPNWSIRLNLALKTAVRLYVYSVLQTRYTYAYYYHLDMDTTPKLFHSMDEKNEPAKIHNCWTMSYE